MAVALYGLLLLLNQQTGLMIENSLTWVFIFPIYIFAAMSTPAAAGCAAASMALLTFLFGGFSTWFYSWTSLATGLAGGITLKKDWPSSWRMALMFVIQFVGNMLMIFVWAGIFDMDLSEDFAMITQYVPWLDPWIFATLFAALLALSIVICVQFVGSTLLRLLHIPTRPLTPVTQIAPHPWIAWLFVGTMAVFAVCPNMVLWNMEVRNLLLLVLVPCFLYLDYYGAVVLLQRCVRTGHTGWSPLIIFGTFIPGPCFIWAIVGLVKAIWRR